MPPDFAGLVDAAIEAGSKPHAVLPSARPRRRRSVGVLMLVVAATAVVLAYRWWRAQTRTVAPLIEEPDRASAAGVPASPVPVPEEALPVTSVAEVEIAPEIPEEEHHETPVEPAEMLAVEQPDDTPQGEAASAPAPAWTPSTQPRRPQGIAASAPVHPQWRFGRGPSAATPPVPAARPSIPGRPRPHLPR